MERRELTCRACQQVNVRYQGAWALLRNPRLPRRCSICRADLETGERNVFAAIDGIVMWASVYGLHAFVGGGGFAVAAALFWPGIINEPRVIVRVLPMVIGAILGLALAERSRRRGALLTNQRPKGRG